MGLLFLNGAILYQFKAKVLYSQARVRVPQAPASFDSVEFNSFIRGYHAYKAPHIGETLLKPTNIKDHSAVSVMKEPEVGGHVLHSISFALSMFL